MLLQEIEGLSLVREGIQEKILSKKKSSLRSSFYTTISEREREALQLICEEMTTPEIAKK